MLKQVLIISIVSALSLSGCTSTSTENESLSGSVIPDVTTKMS
jgi:outer membrane lipoprotein SlyB